MYFNKKVKKLVYFASSTFLNITLEKTYKKSNIKLDIVKTYKTIEITENEIFFYKELNLHLLYAKLNREYLSYFLYFF
jgi:hypothetical protein